MNVSRDPLAPFRRRLLGLGYRMLGSRADAEDVLQDAFIRFSGSKGVQNVEAYLTSVVTRLCLDRLKSARATREIYVGPWLPEPILDPEQLSPEAATELANDVSFAFMLALDALSPAERAAFLLHDVFDLSFLEIAAVLERTEEACRQLAARGRKTVRTRAHNKAPPAHREAPIFRAFLRALATGELAELTKLLKHDAVLVSDSGGLRPTALKPVQGADRIAALLLGGSRKASRSDLQIGRYELALVNGAPSLVTFREDRPDQTMSISTADGVIAAIYIVCNPDKLVRLFTGFPCGGDARLGDEGQAKTATMSS